MTFHDFAAVQLLWLMMMVSNFTFAVVTVADATLSDSSAAGGGGDLSALCTPRMATAET